MKQNTEAKSKKKQGGARPGAGRPRSAEKVLLERTKEAIADAREFVVDKIKEDLADIVVAQINAAKGIRVAAKEMAPVMGPGNIQQKDDKGNPMFEWTGQYITSYTVMPDTKTGEYLINQAAGKPMETMEIGGKGGKPIEVNVTNLSMDEVDAALQKMINKNK